MTRTELTGALSNLSDSETRCELSDWAVNTIRDHLAASGLKATQGNTLLNEELGRIRGAGITLDADGFVPYLRTRRAGSGFRLNRRVRCAVFAQLACRLAR